MARSGGKIPRQTMSQPSNRPDKQLRRLIRGIGSQVDDVIADGVRRLGGEPITQVAMFSQSITSPWDVETAFTAKLAVLTAKRELAKGRSANADRMDEALAVIREHCRKGMTTIVASPNRTIVYWNWTYGYTLCTDPESGSDQKINNFHNSCTGRGQWLPPPQDVLASSLSGIITDLNPAYRAEAEETLRMRLADINSGAREKRTKQLLKAVEDTEKLDTGN